MYNVCQNLFHLNLFYVVITELLTLFLLTPNLDLNNTFADKHKDIRLL